MSVDQCPVGHPTLRSADRRSNGGCAECHRQANRLLRLRNRAALDVVQAFEAAGVQFQQDGTPMPAEQVAAQLAEKFPID